MRGSVVKKGDRYYVKIELDPDPQTGQRRQLLERRVRQQRVAQIELLQRPDRREVRDSEVADFGGTQVQLVEPRQLLQDRDLAIGDRR